MSSQADILSEFSKRWHVWVLISYQKGRSRKLLLKDIDNEDLSI